MLIECRECEGKVSDKAVACPHCGLPKPIKHVDVLFKASAVDLADNETRNKTIAAAYSGEDPYVFISYAHEDKSLVYECMNWLGNNGVHMWYDEGIPPAGEWVEEIATAIKGCSLFLVFISPHAVNSRYVRSEVGYALSLLKDILPVYQKETDLPAGLDLCMKPFQSIRCQEDEDWRENLLALLISKGLIHRDGKLVLK